MLQVFLDIELVKLLQVVLTRGGSKARSLKHVLFRAPRSRPGHQVSRNGRIAVGLSFDGFCSTDALCQCRL